MKIFRAWITLKSGRRLYAKDCGKRAFIFEVDEEIPHRKEEHRSEKTVSA